MLTLGVTLAVTKALDVLPELLRHQAQPLAVTAEPSGWHANGKGWAKEPLGTAVCASPFPCLVWGLSAFPPSRSWAASRGAQRVCWQQPGAPGSVLPALSTPQVSSAPNQPCQDGQNLPELVGGRNCHQTSILCSTNKITAVNK